MCVCVCVCVCVCFFQWHINLCGFFNVKAILVEEQQRYYLT